MAKIDEFTSIGTLFRDAEGNFIIPDYQRPYEWTKDKCQTLWDDIIGFADRHKKSNVEKYFLGSIVTYKKKNGQKEIIDGQQRLTTLMLLLRAFYPRTEGKMHDDIGECIYNTNSKREPVPSKPKIVLSAVIAKKDKEELAYIMEFGFEGEDSKKEMKSNYAKNFRFFQEKIEELTNRKVSSNTNPLFNMINKIMDCCVVLPIEADNEETALTIFSTLNDRGMQLSDADIFKSHLYKHFRDDRNKRKFIDDWKNMEDSAEKCFDPRQGTPMTELFMHYMFCVRAKDGDRSSTTIALRRFYHDYDLTGKNAEETFFNLKLLSEFWKDISVQSTERFSEKVLKKFFVLNYAPNNMWTYIVSVYFIRNKDSKGKLSEEPFLKFLDKITSLIWTYAVIEKTVSDLRTPIFSAMVDIMEGKPVDFSDTPALIDLNKDDIKKKFDDGFENRSSSVIKSMLVWWAFQNANQNLIVPLDTKLEIEHISPKSRKNKNMEWVGNKSVLEKSINISASDEYFSDKKNRYKGIKKNGTKTEPTKIKELLTLKGSDNYYFTEEDVKNRNDKMRNAFIAYLKDNGILKA